MTLASRTHKRQTFFKYMSANTAKLVLANRSLRWSSPLLFNDPFDVPREIAFGLQPVELVQALSRRMIELIENPPENTSKLEYKIQIIVEKVKQHPEIKAEVIKSIKDSAAMHRPAGRSMDELRAWWRGFIPDFRILCLTESPNHVAMWYHYADKYQGVVIEFRCDDALDSPWLIAKPVEYPTAKPGVYTAEGWAELLTMPQELAMSTMIEASTFTKSPDWSSEREWRITSTKRPTDTGHFTDYKFNNKELASVYFGPMISIPDREALTELATRYPSAVVINASIGMSRELQFQQLPVTNH